MRHSLPVIFLLFSIAVYPQKPDSLSKDTSLPVISGSMNSSFESYADSINKEMIKRQTQSSIDFFVQLQKERKAKEKKQAIIRLSIGIGFLIILIIGLLRRRKAKK